MSKKRKPKSANHENRSPLLKFKLNQRIKYTESQLSADELEAFKKLSPSEKRDVVLEASKNEASKAIDTEIIDYFKQLNATN